MSFLAQLRQRADAGRDGASLCYRLSLEGEPLKARLLLRVAEIHDDRPEGNGAPYVIQRTHLRTPPPFLAADDIAILGYLLEADETWLSDSSGALPGGWAFLQLLLATQRCFIDRPGQAPGRLRALAPRPAELNWSFDADGRQHLQWTVEGLAFGFRGSRDRVAYQPGPLALVLLQHDLTNAALDRAKPWFAPQPPEVIDTLLADTGHWVELGLPLPRRLPVQRFTLSPQAVLLCDLPAGSMHPRLRLLFQYANDVCCALLPEEDHEPFRYRDGDSLIEWVRDHRTEEALARELATHLDGFTASADGWWASDTSAWQRLLTATRTLLQPRGFEWRFTPAFIHRFTWAEGWQVTVSPHGSADWDLQLRVNVQGATVDLLALLAHLPPDCLEQGRIPLEDGRLLLLPASQARSLAAELGDLSAPGGVGRLPDSQINRLAAVALALPEDAHWYDDGGLLEHSRQLLQPAQTLPQADLGLRITLRNYQWQGACWLQHLRALGFNGLLADDMGLGKTLQTIAHLSLERSQGRLTRPALIVAPTSLMHNWRQELDRFAPSLRSAVVHGASRHRLWDRINDHDVLITSYNLLVNDLAHWQRQTLSWLVLDEAQWIKNPSTRASQAVRQVAADHRLALTGTPVENHLGELWSIMDFLNPRCLGSERQFRHYFREPIEQQGDASRLQVLLQRIAPWMLRRTKDQVATELPPKTVIQQKVAFTDEQRAFYEELRSNTWSDLDARLAESAHGGEQRVLVLSALLRLRQACCDPALLGHPEIPSGKRQHCLEMVAELVAEGRSVLLFSQFTSMLDLLAQDLAEQGIGHLQLTGQTPADERSRRVTAFQAGEAPVFLISLKAGGVGLTLTRADVVIHYDPWWNDAAERQASDRAHRMGQDKPVFVYQLITEDSVEERIAELQQRKALLGEQVNRRAQASGERFALKFEELVALCRPAEANGSPND